MSKGIYISLIIAVALAGCAGRDPKPVRTVQASDNILSCSRIESKIETNNALMIELAGEEASKVAQNVAAGVAGLFIWPLWFAMDFKDAAGKEGTALQARNQYLGKLYVQNGCALSELQQANHLRLPDAS